MIDPILSKLNQLITSWDSDLFDEKLHFLLDYNSKLTLP